MLHPGTPPTSAAAPTPWALAVPLLPRLRRHARLLTGHPAKADDLVQDTLERACHKWGLWQPQGEATASLLSWLLTVMHRLFLNQLRDSREHLHDSWDDDLSPTHEPHTAVAQRLDLESALARLSPAAREVLVLVCVQECSYQEAAVILNVPVGTVMSRLARAREHLRRLMDATTQTAPRQRADIPRAVECPSPAPATSADAAPSLRVVK